MKERKIKHLKAIARILDTQFEGPFRIRFGLDGILGLIPGIGDFITTSASLYILINAAKLGCGPSTLIRMGFNIALENIVDMVPLLGNLFDFYWKSNLKNIALLERHLANPKEVRKNSRVLIISVLLFLTLILFSTVYLSFLVIMSLYSFIFS